MKKFILILSMVMSISVNASDIDTSIIDNDEYLSLKNIGACEAVVIVQTTMDYPTYVTYEESRRAVIKFLKNTNYPKVSDDQFTSGFIASIDYYSLYRFTYESLYQIVVIELSDDKEQGKEILEETWSLNECFKYFTAK